jgi:hypothetical protein
MGNEEATAHRFRSEPYIVVADADACACAGGSLCDDLAPERIVASASHWSVFLPDRQLALVGYGIDSHACVLNDIWRLDLRARVALRAGGFARRFAAQRHDRGAAGRPYLPLRRVLGERVRRGLPRPRAADAFE